MDQCDNRRSNIDELLEHIETCVEDAEGLVRLQAKGRPYPDQFAALLSASFLQQRRCIIDLSVMPGGSRHLEWPYLGTNLKQVRSETVSQTGSLSNAGNLPLQCGETLCGRAWPVIHIVYKLEAYIHIFLLPGHVSASSPAHVWEQG